MWISVIYMHLYTVFFFSFSRYPHTDFSGHRGSHDHATGASGGSQWPRLSVLPVAPATRAGAQRIQRRTAAWRALSRAVRRSADSSLLSVEIIADEYSKPMDSSPPFSNYYAHSSFSLIPLRRWGRGRAGAGQGAHPANRREDHGQVQSQGGGDASALFCSWRGTFVDYMCVISKFLFYFKPVRLSFCCKENIL